MKKIGLLIVVLSFIGTTGPLIASTEKPSVKTQSVGEGERPCPCGKNKGGKVPREKAGVGAASFNNNEKATEATGAQSGGGEGHKPEPSGKK